MQLIASFEGGEQAQGLFSFDSALERAGVLEVHGTEGSMFLPDPNHFVGEISRVEPLGVLLDDFRPEQERLEMPLQGAEVGRGLGLLDMVRAIAAGVRTWPRASSGITCSTCCCRRRSRPPGRAS